MPAIYFVLLFFCFVDRSKKMAAAPFFCSRGGTPHCDACMHAGLGGGGLLVGICGHKVAVDTIIFFGCLHAGF